MIQQGVMEQEVKDVLRADDYVTRDYAASPTKVANLFVAFFKSQRAGQTPHSPKNCLPGSGWVWTVSDTIPVTLLAAQIRLRSTATLFQRAKTGRWCCIGINPGIA